MLDVGREELWVELSHLVDTLPPPEGDGDCRGGAGPGGLLSVRGLTGAPAGSWGCLALLQDGLVGTKTESAHSDVAAVSDLFPYKTARSARLIKCWQTLPGIKELQH